MTDQIIERPTTELVEIDRHKYYLSEKAGHDVGWEFAEQDWEANHATTFRAEAITPEPTCSVTDSVIEEISCDKAIPGDADATLRIDDAQQTGFGKVLKRIFTRNRTRNV